EVDMRLAAPIRSFSHLRSRQRVEADAHRCQTTPESHLGISQEPSHRLEKDHMITRRKLCFTLAAATLAPYDVFSQSKPARVARIGLLSYLSEPDVALTMLVKG